MFNCIVFNWYGYTVFQGIMLEMNHTYIDFFCTPNIISWYDKAMVTALGMFDREIQMHCQ